jgi:hypothetical protein
LDEKSEFMFEVYYWLINDLLNQANKNRSPNRSPKMIFLNQRSITDLLSLLTY